MPVLFEENIDAINVWLACRGQVISVGMGEVVDINHLAVWKYIDEFEIKNRKDCFSKVIKVFHHILQYQKDNNTDTKTYNGLKQE